MSKRSRSEMEKGVLGLSRKPLSKGQQTEVDRRKYQMSRTQMGTGYAEGQAWMMNKELGMMRTFNRKRIRIYCPRCRLLGISNPIFRAQLRPHLAEHHACTTEREELAFANQFHQVLVDHAAYARTQRKPTKGKKSAG